MPSPGEWFSYRLHRMDPDVRAKHALAWARHTLAAERVRFISTLPYSDKPVYLAVPGVGVLRFTIKDDYDHNPYDGDGHGFQWVDTSDWDSDDHRGQRTGARLWDNCYSLNWWDRRSVYAIRFDKKAGSRLEDRRAYWCAQGYSKQDAHLKACRSIQQECEYWHKVCEGQDISFVGAIVELFTEDDESSKKPTSEESCWGFEYPDTDNYLLDEMNGWAHSLVVEEWKKRHGTPSPSTFVQGKDPAVDAAWRAWQTAMVASDADRELADPVFVSTYKENISGRQLHSGRVVQVRTRAG